jgi:hypothetical protein
MAKETGADFTRLRVRVLPPHADLAEDAAESSELTNSHLL